MRATHKFYCFMLVALAALQVSIGAHAHVAQTHKKHPTPTPTPTATPRPRKTPPGARGFAQYAGRDASDKLLTGGASRGLRVTSAQAAFLEGQAQYDKHNLEAAAAAFAQAIKLNPHFAEAHYSLATVLTELDRWDEAVAEFQSALAEQPSDNIRLLATYNLANAYLDLGNYNEAVNYFQRTIQLLPTEANPHYNLGLTYVALNQKDRAAQEFKEALRLNPKYAEAQFNLALVYWQTGQQTAARAEQQKLKALNAKMARDLDALFK
jgi:tetratricopeptide (TPR) repeat protein